MSRERSGGMSVERFQGWAWVDCDVCGAETEAVPFQTGADPTRPDFATDPEPAALAAGWVKVGHGWQCPACFGRGRAGATCADIACPECHDIIPPGMCCGGCFAEAWAAGEDTAPYMNPMREGARA
jgi:hypothetical protein